MFPVPKPLAANCKKDPDNAAWLDRLPSTVEELRGRWSLDLDKPFANSGAAWVAPDRKKPVVLKLGMPHDEARDEIPGLRVWNGNGIARMHECDEPLNAMLLERCSPGTPLKQARSAEEQDAILCPILRRLWKAPADPATFRPLSDMTAKWAASCRTRSDRWFDTPLVEEALCIFEELPLTAPSTVLLATDLHAGNVLAAEREPWLAIDPKPYIGDPAYDATQHLFNTTDRLYADPAGTFTRLAGLLDVDAERIRLWTFARACIHRPGGPNDVVYPFIRAIAP